MENNTKNSKKDFLENEIETLSIFAAFGRAKIYSVNVGEHQKIEFKEFIRRRLKRFRSEYKDGEVSEIKHISNIQKFADEISSSCYKGILSGGRFRIGIAQKLLNLYLKYLWVLGWMQKPPWHCPFDYRIIFRLSGIESKCTWTKCDHIDCYKSWVKSAKEESNNSIAEWELKIWNDKFLYE